MARKTDEQILADLGTAPDGRLARDVNLWTLEKLATLQLYLKAFATACQSVGGGIFVDGLAGPGMCRVQDAVFPPEFVHGSSLIALQTRPMLERCLSIEKGPNEAKVLRERSAPFGERAIVKQGDVNSDLVPLIEKYVGGAPCFCLLDPEGSELDWSTIAALASIGRRSRKIELFILFPLEMGTVRLFPLKKNLDPASREVATRTFGGDEWEVVYRARRDGLGAPEAKARYLNLYQDKLRRLGYKHVREKPIKAPSKPGGSRRTHYHLIFATDHPVGDEIMEDIFERPYILQFPVTGQRGLGI